MKSEAAIKIIFENGEYCEVPDKHIKYLSLTDITDSVSVTYIGGITGERVSRQKAAGSCILMLEEASDVFTSHRRPLGERLLDSPDVSAVQIIRPDKEDEPIFVPWLDRNASGEENSYQTVKKSPKGDVIIVSMGRGV